MKYKATVTVIFIGILLFTRFYNLDRTARFIWDESSDLVRIHQYYVNHTLSLVGPISENGDKVFGSLTYYMLMPSAVLGNFDPVSTAYGSAFWGVLTVLLILFLTNSINKKFPPYMMILSLIWYPLLLSERWAWNPNLIPFWIALGLTAYQKQTNFFAFISGILLGLSIHHHYLAVFAVTGFVVGQVLLYKQHGWFSRALLLSVGVAVTLLPFILFDFRHPPGLFLSRVLYFNHLGNATTITGFLLKIWQVCQVMFFYYTQLPVLALLLGISSCALMVWDIRFKKAALVYAAPCIFQLLGLIFITPIFNYYFIPTTVFYLAWLIYPRAKVGTYLAFFNGLLLLLGSFFTVIPLLTRTSWESDIHSTRLITNIISDTIHKNNLQNVNLAALHSQDPNTYGWRYRDLLLITNNNLKTRYEYPISDHLFVVSPSRESELRLDPATEMDSFRNSPLKQTWHIPNSAWKLYLFDRK